MGTERNTPIRIILIEDNRFIRSGIEMILNSEADFKLIGSYSSCEEAFTSNNIPGANLVVMDMRLPGTSGNEGIKYLRKHHPKILVIIYSAFEDDEQIVKAITAGAAGYVSKKTSAKDLLSTLRNISIGGSPLTPNAARYILAKFKNQLFKEFRLNEQEKKILQKIASGKSYSKVAHELSETEIKILINIRSIYLKIQNDINHLTIN